MLTELPGNAVVRSYGASNPAEGTPSSKLCRREEQRHRAEAAHTNCWAAAAATVPEGRYLRPSHNPQNKRDNRQVFPAARVSLVSRSLSSAIADLR